MSKRSLPAAIKNRVVKRSKSPKLKDLPELIIALDFATVLEARRFISKVSRSIPKNRIIFKVGFELFLAGGPAFVRSLTRKKFRVFLDLKFYDIPNTVAHAVKQVIDLKVEMFTLHLSGGEKMVRAVCDQIKKVKIKPKILGVSVLTSFDQVGWSQVFTLMGGGELVQISEGVAGLVKGGQEWGVDGIVCSAHELKKVRSLGPDLYWVIPGVRPAGVAAQDQGRVVTPAQARDWGASAIVVGRPITQAADPVFAIESILNELSGVKSGR